MKNQKKKTYQFKREKGNIGESKKVYFCEIEAYNKKEAISYVKKTDVNSLPWRWIGSYDQARENYDEVSFECILD